MRRTFPKVYVHGQNSQRHDCIRPVSGAECAALVLTYSIIRNLQGDMC